MMQSPDIAVQSIPANTVPCMLVFLMVALSDIPVEDFTEMLALSFAILTNGSMVLLLCVRRS